MNKEKCPAFMIRYKKAYEMVTRYYDLESVISKLQKMSWRCGVYLGSQEELGYVILDAEFLRIEEIIQRIEQSMDKIDSECYDSFGLGISDLKYWFDNSCEIPT